MGHLASQRCAVDVNIQHRQENPNAADFFVQKLRFIDLINGGPHLREWVDDAVLMIGRCQLAKIDEEYVLTRNWIPVLFQPQQQVQQQSQPAG